MLTKVFWEIARIVNPIESEKNLVQSLNRQIVAWLFGPFKLPVVPITLRPSAIAMVVISIFAINRLRPSPTQTPEELSLAMVQLGVFVAVFVGLFVLSLIKMATNFRDPKLRRLVTYEALVYVFLLSVMLVHVFLGSDLSLLSSVPPLWHLYMVGNVILGILVSAVSFLAIVWAYRRLCML